MGPVKLRCADVTSPMPSVARMTGAVGFFLAHQHDPEVEKSLAAAVGQFPKSWVVQLDIVTYQKLAPLLT